MSAKRAAESSSAMSAGAPPPKKLLTKFQPFKIGTISNLEEMDIKVLQFQNKKLAERIDIRRKAEEELMNRIEQLEQRQTTDDAVLCIVNRYWNQLDEDVRLLLQRFDAEVADEAEKENESQAVTSFLTLLSQWDKPEMEGMLNQRVEFSKRAIGKMLQAFDRLLQRNERLMNAVKDKAEKMPEDEEEKNEEDDKSEVKQESPIKKESDETSAGGAEVKAEMSKSSEAAAAGTDEGQAASAKQDGGKKSIKEEPGKGEVVVKTEPMSTGDSCNEKSNTDSKVNSSFTSNTSNSDNYPSLKEVIWTEIAADKSENKRLHKLLTEQHKIRHEMNIQNAELSEKLSAAQDKVAELGHKCEDLEYHLANSQNKVDKLDRALTDYMQRYESLEEGDIKVSGGIEGVSKRKFDEIMFQLSEQQSLATDRLSDLELLQKEHQKILKENEQLKMDLSTLPEAVIVETVEYKCLQSQFSVLYNESMQMKTQLEETRNLLQTTKNTHMRQIEQMESDELACQKKLRTEAIQLEDQLSQVRREYEMLRLEFEQTLAANEQTGPINREMRNLITSLKNHNEQLKGEVARYKRKLKDSQAEVNKLKAEISNQPQEVQAVKERESSPPPSQIIVKTSREVLHPSGTPTRGTPPASSSGAGATNRGSPEHPTVIIVKGEEEILAEERDRERDKHRTPHEQIKELRVQLKKSQDSCKELKLLLDMYKSAAKETRDKAILMAAEKRAHKEIEDLKNHIRRLQEAERKERRKLAEDEALRRISRLETTIAEQTKSLTAQKQEEEAFLNELEVTGQAFEDMQEQNIRLLQQLREKDDANFKLMSERIKSNQIHKLLREENQVLAKEVSTLVDQVEAQNLVVQKLEEKEQILQNNLATIEKELALRQQASELHRRKAVESSQSATDLKLHLDKYHAQLKDAQNAVANNTSGMHQEMCKHKRVQEELAILRKKLERAKKIEQASSADEVLMEEIREYKEQLTCPSCKVKKKDAVLTKCFHVFCLECLKTRYETRQRKCPKCNATFGANDYHRLYLG